MIPGLEQIRGLQRQLALAASQFGDRTDSRIEIIVCVPAGCDAAEDRPPGAYPNAAGNVVDVVYASDDPDAEIERLRTRMNPKGLVVVCHR